MAIPSVVICELAEYVNDRDLTAFCLTNRDHADYLDRDKCDICSNSGGMCLKKKCSNDGCNKKSCINKGVQITIIDKIRGDFKKFYCEWCAFCQDCRSYSFNSNKYHTNCSDCGNIYCNRHHCIVCQSPTFLCMKCDMKVHKKIRDKYPNSYRSWNLCLKHAYLMETANISELFKGRVTINCYCCNRSLPDSCATFLIKNLVYCHNCAKNYV